MKATGGILASERDTKAIPFNVRAIRGDFPILKQRVHGKPLAYLDNAATSQKPSAVIEATARYYAEDNSNIHRGVHLLSQRATDQYEAARLKAQRFINAARSEEVIFVRGTTEAINLVASTFGRENVGAEDEVLITEMEHHSNIVPWQILCEEKRARLRVAPINDQGELIIEEFDNLLSERTRIVSLVHISNALGTINPIRRLIESAHRAGAVVLIDGAQAAPHAQIDVQSLGCDFYAFSGHKVYGPTGVGVLYGKASLLDRMPPYHGGGDMIASVTFEKTTYNVLPYKFEAGTPNIAGTIGLGAAIDYVNHIGLENIARYEGELLTYGTETLSRIPGLRLIGTANEKASILSFVLDGIHPHDVGTVLDREGIAIRTGHHCTMPLMQRLGIPATSRASLAFYNTTEEIDALVKGIQKVKEVLGS
ncbi:MAG TPA: cysteine desulfurase [Blastocatellia bacterium]|nr:cysteine desulfurase [Blastocatellia bacterium]